MRFHYVFENDISLYQLTIVILEKFPVEKEPKVTTKPDIPYEQVTLEKGYYHCVYIVLCFKKEFSFYSKENQVDM